MRFIEKKFREIGGNMNEYIGGYNEIVRHQSSEDIKKNFSDFYLYTTYQDNIIKYIIVHNKKQIGICNIIIDQNKKEYYVSSIAIVGNLQRKGIASNLYKYIQSNMLDKYPEYSFVSGIYQTNIGKKLRTKK